jgi:hypothetical protein
MVGLVTDVDLVYGHVERVGKALLGTCAGFILGLEVGFEDVMLLLCEAGLHVCAAGVVLRRSSRRWLSRPTRWLRRGPLRSALAVAREGRHVVAKAVHTVLWCAPRQGDHDGGVLRCGRGLEGEEQWGRQVVRSGEQFAAVSAAGQDSGSSAGEAGEEHGTRK